MVNSRIWNVMFCSVYKSICKLINKDRPPAWIISIMHYHQVWFCYYEIPTLQLLFYSVRYLCKNEYKIHDIPLSIAVILQLSFWLTSLGFSLCTGTITAKMFRIYYVFHNPIVRKFVRIVPSVIFSYHIYKLDLIPAFVTCSAKDLAL